MLQSRQWNLNVTFVINVINKNIRCFSILNTASLSAKINNTQYLLTPVLPSDA